jgi:hypothetical protein
MKLHSKILYFLFILIIIVFSSCKKNPDSYPIVPEIDFKSFIPSNKYEAVLTLTFTDGDGDIGLKTSDTIGIYDKSSPYYYNLYIKTLYKSSNGIFKDTLIYDVLTNKIDSGLIKQRVQFVEKTTKEDYLKGHFVINLNGYRQSLSHKTIKYKIYFYDRALHKSNEIETPELIVP